MVAVIWLLTSLCPQAFPLPWRKGTACPWLLWVLIHRPCLQTACRGPWRHPVLPPQTPLLRELHVFPFSWKRLIYNIQERPYPKLLLPLNLYIYKVWQSAVFQQKLSQPLIWDTKGESAQACPPGAPSFEGTQTGEWVASPHFFPLPQPPTLQWGTSSGEAGQVCGPQGHFLLSCGSKSTCLRGKNIWELFLLLMNSVSMEKSPDSAIFIARNNKCLFQEAFGRRGPSLRGKMLWRKRKEGPGRGGGRSPSETPQHSGVNQPGKRLPFHI